MYIICRQNNIYIGLTTIKIDQLNIQMTEKIISKCEIFLKQLHKIDI